MKSLPRHRFRIKTGDEIPMPATIDRLMSAIQTFVLQQVGHRWDETGRPPATITVTVTMEYEDDIEPSEYLYSVLGFRKDRVQEIIGDVDVSDLGHWTRPPEMDHSGTVVVAYVNPDSGEEEETEIKYEDLATVMASLLTGAWRETLHLTSITPDDPWTAQDVDLLLQLAAFNERKFK